MLSKKISRLKPSPTLALAAKAKALKAEGKDVVSLTVGEPDWPSYNSAKEGGIQAIQDNKTTYTPASGIPALRAEIAKVTSKQTGVAFEAANVSVSPGAKYIIYAALYALCDQGDEVLIPAPYWVSYPTMVELAGGVPKIIECGIETDFKMTAVQLRAAINKKTKVLLLNSPSNPTGAEYSKEELGQIVEVLKDFPDVVVLSDDIYNQLSFSDQGLSPHVLQIDPGLKDRVVCINGMSKAYAMTGWRMGWAVGPSSLIKAMGSFQSQTTGAPSSISQWASLAALQKCQSDIQESLKALKERRTFFVDQVSQIPGTKLFAPEGAFYLWLNVQEWAGKSYQGAPVESSRKVAETLLKDQLLAVVAGEEFGMAGYLRCSFAASNENLTKAVQRLKAFAEQLS